jgi:hypothetical protein
MGGPLPKKIFFMDSLQVIHHLKALVELTRFPSVLKSFRVFFVQKQSKNSVNF